MEPLFDIVEGFIVSHIIDNNDTVCTSVVGGSDGAETFLSSSVPNLEFDCLSVKLNCADFLIEKIVDGQNISSATVERINKIKYNARTNFVFGERGLRNYPHYPSSHTISDATPLLSLVCI